MFVSLLLRSARGQPRPTAPALDDGRANERVATTPPAQRMSRGGGEAQGLIVVPQSSSSLAATVDDDDDDESTTASHQHHTQECCPRPLHPEHAQGLHELFRRLWRPVGTTATTADSSYDRITSSTITDSKIVPPSPLRQARSFDSSSDIPCIGASEVVVPGSDLQKEMAKLMMHSKLADDDEECVICMEGFDPTNPRMPTHCGCGKDKTYFHLPCLYQWLEQSSECPSCREKLTWEEFS